MIYTALTALLIAGIVWYLEFGAYSIPVLYYHHVEPTDPARPEVFEAQMQYLAGKGYHSVSLNELYGFMTGSGRVPRKSFVLTFDDGFYCNYHYLLPILKKYRLDCIHAKQLRNAKVHGIGSDGKGPHPVNIIELRYLRHG